MNKRRRFKAKARRKFFNGVRGVKWAGWNPPYQVCTRCGDYIMACTCWEEDEAITRRQNGSERRSEKDRETLRKAR